MIATWIYWLWVWVWQRFPCPGAAWIGWCPYKGVHVFDRQAWAMTFLPNGLVSLGKSGETMAFPMTYGVSCKFSLKPIHFPVKFGLRLPKKWPGKRICADGENSASGESLTCRTEHWQSLPNIFSNKNCRICKISRICRTYRICRICRSWSIDGLGPPPLQ